MHHQPQGDSIWGNINTVIEVALNVYYIFAENGEGIMIPKDTVSEKAAAAGTEDNGYLYYDLTTCAVPLNELRQIYDEVDNLIVSEDSLYATLGTNFRAYVMV